jgi:ATP-dependent Clp protease adaptor protein ClpS
MGAPVTTPAPVREARGSEDLAPLYNVVLLDDDDHTYDYVVEMLMKLFFMTADEAFRRAVEVDTAKRTVVLTCDLPAAEFARDQIHSYGADWRLERSKGSMSAIVEPASSVA